MYALNEVCVCPLQEIFPQLFQHSGEFVRSDLILEDRAGRADFPLCQEYERMNRVLAI